MKKIIVLLVVALAATGCSKTFQTWQSVYQQVTSATVTPQQIYLATNTFDGVEATATQYLLYCKGHLTSDLCDSLDRRVVFRAVRSGRAARDKLKEYRVAGTNAPAAVYNTLVAAINSINASKAVSGGVPQQ